jgi:endoglucanase
MRTDQFFVSALRRGFFLLSSSSLFLAAACGDLTTAPELAAMEAGGPPAPLPVGPPAGAFRGAALYVDPASPARKQVEAWRLSRPHDAVQLEKIASQPQAVWIGDWNPEPFAEVDRIARETSARGALPVFVAYNIPQRDCGLHSAGGAAGAAAYQRWISEVARGIGARRAVVILEPDAVAGLDCLSPADQEGRLEMIRRAVRTLGASGSVSVYIDAGNARWHSPDTIAGRLQRAGITEADGFALNVSNFLGNAESIAHGEAISARVGGKHFVIDTSRNGAGPTADAEWCNPGGRALGTRPTGETGHPLVDAFLWIKTPGESDGTCNGGPRAGEWWPDYALMLARNAGA